MTERMMQGKTLEPESGLTPVRFAHSSRKGAKNVLGLKS